MATIIDSNLTTLIAAAVLFLLGSGPVKGFAVTLAIGIITTVFTAFTFTRLMIAWWVRARRPTRLPQPLLNFVPYGTTFSFMAVRNWAFSFSIITSVLSVLFLAIWGLNLGVDFRGGALIEVKSKTESADLEAIRSTLGDLNIGEVQVQNFGSPSEVLIRVGSQDQGDAAEQSTEAKVRNALSADYEFRRVEVVGPSVSSELTQKGIIALVVALLAIGVYVWFRFEWQFAIGAIIATAHDLFLTIGMFAILQMEFSLTSVAAVLTIVGYSINDTVVVYDRIRENLRKYKKMPIPELIDLSVNQTLSRTLLTGVTTLLALIALYFLGGEVLAGFSFAMIFGILVGTYSSVFIASPILILFKLRPGQLSEEKVVASPFAGVEATGPKQG
jgi:SecD/SecF fusion protein